MNRTRTLCAVAGIAAAGAALAYLAGLGPLDPPAGPVTETSPSLAELDAKLDQVLLNTGGLGDESLIGPWEVFRVPATGALADNPNGTTVVDGPVYVKSFTAYRTSAAVFDGTAGRVDSGGAPLDENWIARNVQAFFNSEVDGRGQEAPSVIPVDQVLDDGMHVAWDRTSATGFLMVTYRELGTGGQP